MANKIVNKKLILSLTTVCFCCCVLIRAAYAENSYSSYAAQRYPANVYFGDTHVHTNLSLDANYLGNKRLGPDFDDVRR